jgi:hypothetical protein
MCLLDLSSASCSCRGDGFSFTKRNPSLTAMLGWLHACTRSLFALTSHLPLRALLVYYCRQGAAASTATGLRCVCPAAAAFPSLLLAPTTPLPLLRPVLILRSRIPSPLQLRFPAAAAVEDCNFLAQKRR